MEEALKAADEVIADIKASNGSDYSAVRQELADLFNNTLWEGNYSAHTDFDGLRNLWIIQEDEYDQSMDEDEKPAFDSQICYSAGHYIFPA